VRNLQAAEECKGRDILIAIGNFGQLALKIAYIGLEDVAMPHFNGEKVVVVLLGLPTRGVLSEEHFSSSSKLWREWGGLE